MRKLILLKASLIVLILIPFVSFGQQQRDTIELRNFGLQSSTVVQEDGKQLSSVPYKGRSYWFPVKVPTTVQAGLVNNDVYPSPYFGMNNMLIPDMSDSTNEAYNLFQYSHLPNQKNPWKDPYWYRTSFELPNQNKGRQNWLHFKGINYRAEVWLNGQQIADSTQMVGMFDDYRFDVSSVINQDSTNYLAVKIFPLDYPGLPSPPQLEPLGPFYPNGGPSGDIGQNVTMLSSVGWDWMPAVRDREMGIWQPVFIESSGPVTIEEPHITTELPDLPDTTAAGLIINLKLSNHSSDAQRGRLRFTIKPENFDGQKVTYRTDQQLEAGETKNVSFSYEDIEELKMSNPRLWWPNGYGNPNLYNLTISYSTVDKVSNVKKITFGVRTVSSKVTDVNGWARRDFYVNGRNIKLTGGAWVPDMMLQRDSLRYVQEMNLIRNSNFNTVRIWGGGIAPPDAFYNQADRNGLLVWQDFWVTGDTNGEFKGSPDWPYDGDVYIDNMKSTIKRVRNHPSLLVWTGGNEGHARKELYDAMRQNVAQLDGTRPFIPSSSGFAELPEDWKGSWPDDEQSGVYSGGPYAWQPPEQYYALVEKGEDWVWKDEAGMPSQPTYSSLPKIIPNLVPDTTRPYPFNKMWAYHDAASGNGKYDTYYRAINERYGEAVNLKDYSEKAQLVNARGYRAMFEAVGSQLSNTGGLLLWKLNAAFPSVIWQVYDWYLNPNAGYYFAKRAVEPLHPQLNLDDSTVTIVNRRFRDRKNLNLNVRFYDDQLKEQNVQNYRTNAPAEKATEVQSIASKLRDHNALTFVELTLREENNAEISQNVYWLAPNDNYKAMQSLPQVNLNFTEVSKAVNEENSWNIKLRNPSNSLAFFIHTKITDVAGEEVLPTYWSDNYISIAPNATKTLHVNIGDAEISGENLYISIDGLNAEGSVLPLRTE